MSDRSTRSELQRERWLRTRGPRLSAASLLLIGLILGVSGALYYAWIAEPVVFTEASPARMSDRHKAEYLLLISQSYEADGNWEKAQERLVALGEEDTRQMVASYLEASLRSGQPAPVMKSLAQLAGRLGIENQAVIVFAPPATQTAAAAPAAATSARETVAPEENQSPTSTPPPTRTPTPLPSPTAVPVYRLLNREQVCSPDGPVSRIEVVAVDPFLEDLPGAEVIVEWDGGSDNFFTGYHPEKGLGYGDFAMSPDVTYQAKMAEGSQVVSGLRVVICEESEGGFAGGWRLTFQNTDIVQDGSGS